MADQPTPRRRFQFRLRTLMIVVTLLAIPCGYVGWQVKIVKQRNEMLSILTTNGGILWPEYTDDGAQEMPWIRRLLGDHAVNIIFFPIEMEASTRAKIRAAFPGAAAGPIPPGLPRLPLNK
jgi:hypothetical protein